MANQHFALLMVAVSIEFADILEGVEVELMGVEIYMSSLWWSFAWAISISISFMVI